MKIVIAPDSFKNCMSAKQICNVISNAIYEVNKNINCVLVPMADGGEGTTISLVDATNGKIINLKSTGPNYQKVKSYYGILGDDKTAVIEMAVTSGFSLATEKNPYFTTTYGVGELIKNALDKGITNFIIGLGGSATNDAGLGMLRALGAKFLDKNDEEIKDAFYIDKIVKFDFKNFDKRLKHCTFNVACDVTNTFTGENGASRIFGPQKGATTEMVDKLDNNLIHFSKLIKKFNNVDVEVPGAGAAGGLGGAFIAFFNTTLEKGVNLVIKTTNLEKEIKDCDMVITGEGSSDYQTKFGKTPYGVLCCANKYNKPVFLFSGKIKNEEELKNIGFKNIYQISPENIHINEAIKNAPVFLHNKIIEIFKNILL